MDYEVGYGKPPRHSMRKQIRAVAAESRADRGQASGTQLLQELIEGHYAVASCQPQFDKVMSIHPQTAMIGNGFVRRRNRALWLAPNRAYRCARRS